MVTGCDPTGTTCSGTGTGEPGCIPSTVMVFDCDGDGLCHTVDDFPLPVVSVMINGMSFKVVLVTPLMPGQKIYVTDGCNDPELSPPFVFPAPAVAPLMSRDMMVILVAALSLVGLLGLSRLRLNN